MKMPLSFRFLSLALVACALAACVDTNPKEPAGSQPMPGAQPMTMHPAMPADPSLTHRYSFTTDARDSVGKVDGMLKGSAKIAGGKLVLAGDAMNSDDANLPYLEFAGPILPKSGSASIAIWFTCGEKTGTYAPRLLDIGDRDGNVGAAFLYFTPHFTSTDNFRAAITATNSSARIPLDGPRLDDNQPHLVVIALDAAQMHVFVDGKEPTPAVGLGENTLANVRQAHSWIGRSGFDQDNGLTGSVDEIRTYNRTLTLADAAALAKAGPNQLP